MKTIKKEKPEQSAFEFRKLEFIPKIPVANVATMENIVNQKNEKQHRKKILQYGVGATLILGLGLAFAFNSEKQQSSLAISKPLVKHEVAVLPKISPPPQATKALNLNYYDSVVFLNEVSGSKIVVSKGMDDYIKKEKIIVKAQEHYYNCFCNDLILHYKVGEMIP